MTGKNKNAYYKKLIKGDLYFIGFGVTKYMDSKLDLKYAHRDVLDLAGIFKLTVAYLNDDDTLSGMSINNSRDANADQGDNVVPACMKFG